MLPASDEPFSGRLVVFAAVSYITIRLMNAIRCGSDRQPESKLDRLSPDPDSATSSRSADPPRRPQPSSEQRAATHATPALAICNYDHRTIADDIGWKGLSRAGPKFDRLSIWGVAPFWTEPIVGLGWSRGIVWLPTGSTSSFYPHNLELPSKFGHRFIRVIPHPFHSEMPTACPTIC